MHKLRFLLLFPCVMLLSGLCHGQSFVLDLPLQSQHAVVTQRIGLTDITINYYRPLVNNREIWGKLVPYGEVWRTGANENTTFTVSDPVTVEGKPLERGTYGLHMIPTADQWTVIFSKTTTAWGSFSYDPAEDVLRVTVKPVAAEFHNALTFDFDDLKPDSAAATLRWEKLAVPFRISVDVNQVVIESLHKQLRGLVRFTWEGWNDAADYLVTNHIDLDEGLRFAEEAVRQEENFSTLTTKANALEALGRKDEAAKVRSLALEKATAGDLYGNARQLQGQKKQDEAFAMFRANAKKYPDYWLSHVGLARVYSAQGNFAEAIKEENAALAVAPETGIATIKLHIRRLEAKEDINK